MQSNENAQLIKTLQAELEKVKWINTNLSQSNAALKKQIEQLSPNSTGMKGGEKTVHFVSQAEPANSAWSYECDESEIIRERQKIFR